MVTALIFCSTLLAGMATAFAAVVLLAFFGMKIQRPALRLPVMLTLTIGWCMFVWCTVDLTVPVIHTLMDDYVW